MKIIDVAESARRPTADITLLKESKLIERLPAGVSLWGDPGYVGLKELHPLKGKGHLSIVPVANVNY